MALSDAQTRTLAAMRAENGGDVSHHFRGMVMKRDGRIVSLSDPSERHRSGDPDCLCIEQDDDPADVVAFAKDETGKDTAEVASREKQPNDSDLQEVATKHPNAK